MQILKKLNVCCARLFEPVEFIPLIFFHCSCCERGGVRDSAASAAPHCRKPPANPRATGSFVSKQHTLMCLNNIICYYYSILFVIVTEVILCKTNACFFPLERTSTLLQSYIFFLKLFFSIIVDYIFLLKQTNLKNVEKHSTLTGW